MEQNSLNQAKELIESAQKIVIISHVSPDGDAVGSSLGLQHILTGLGKQVQVILPNDSPAFLKWLPGFDSVMDYEKNPELAANKVSEADVLFCLDFNDPKRAEGLQNSIETFGKPIICIDHHQQPSDFATVLFSDVNACSTCQMIFDFAVGCGWKAYITPESGECIYTGIMTDTGSFKYYNTTAHTHQVVAELIELGIDNTAIHRKVMDTNSFDRLKLTGYALGEKLELLEEYDTCVLGLTMDEMNRFNCQKGDTEGLVNMGLSVGKVKVSAFFKEAENKIKISFRSKGDFSVNLLAREHFNGGGHTNAAGGMFLGTVEEAIAHFKSVLPNFKNEIADA